MRRNSALLTAVHLRLRELLARRRADVRRVRPDNNLSSRCKASLYRVWTAVSPDRNESSAKRNCVFLVKFTKKKYINLYIFFNKILVQKRLNYLTFLKKNKNCIVLWT